MYVSVCVCVYTYIPAYIFTYIYMGGRSGGPLSASLPLARARALSLSR